LVEVENLNKKEINEKDKDYWNGCEQITTDPKRQDSSVIYGDRIVWLDTRS